MTDEQIFQLLENGEHEKAYYFLKDRYKKTKKDEDLYRLTMIDLRYNIVNDIDSNLLDLLELVDSKNKQIRELSYTPLLSILLDQEDVNGCYYYGLKALNEGINNFYSHYCFALGSFYYYEDTSEEIIKHALEALEDDEVNDEIKQNAHILINLIYIKTSSFEEAKKRNAKLILTSPNKDIVKLLDFQLKIAMTKGKVEESIVDEILEKEYKLDALNFAVDFLSNEKLYDEAIKYLHIIIKQSEDNFQAYNKIASLYRKEKKYNEAIETLSIKELENNPESLELLGQLYQEIGYKSDLILARRCFKKSADIEYDPYRISKMGEISFYLRDEKGLRKAIEILEDDTTDYMSFYYLKYLYFMLTHDFDKGEEEIKRAIKQGYIDYSDELYTTFVKKPSIRHIAKNIKKINSNNVYFNIRTKFYGEYGKKTNQDELIKVISMIEDEEMDSFLYTLIGNIYESFLDKEKAKKLYIEAYERYINKVDSSTCSVAFMANMYLRGELVRQDVAKAKQMTKKIIDQNLSLIDENIYCIYAEACITDGSVDDDLYQLLCDRQVRRYPLGLLFTIIKVGKILNKNNLYYIKEFKRGLKYCSLREKKYYLSSPKIFMMINHKYSY